MDIFTQNEGKMAELVVDALVENLNQVLAFTEEQLDLFGCSMKLAMKIQIAVEEIYVNIAHYAYGNETGKASVLMEHLPDISSVRITFKDSGTPYNHFFSPGLQNASFTHKCVANFCVSKYFEAFSDSNSAFTSVFIADEINQLRILGSRMSLGSLKYCLEHIF